MVCEATVTLNSDLWLPQANYFLSWRTLWVEGHDTIFNCHTFVFVLFIFSVFVVFLYKWLNHCSSVVWLIRWSATAGAALVLNHQRLIILQTKHRRANKQKMTRQHKRSEEGNVNWATWQKNLKPKTINRKLHLEAGGAHGDAHIWQQGAFDQDVPPAHGAQRWATHLDGDKVGAPLLLGHTETHPCFNMDPSVHLVQLVEY